MFCLQLVLLPPNGPKKSVITGLAHKCIISFLFKKKKKNVSIILEQLGTVVFSKHYPNKSKLHIYCALFPDGEWLMVD